MNNIQIKYNGCDIECHYSIQPAEPDNGIQGPYIDVLMILYEGVDVTELLGSQWGDIENAIWKALDEMLEDEQP